MAVARTRPVAPGATGSRPSPRSVHGFPVGPPSTSASSEASATVRVRAPCWMVAARTPSAGACGLMFRASPYLACSARVPLPAALSERGAGCRHEAVLRLLRAPGLENAAAPKERVAGQPGHRELIESGSSEAMQEANPHQLGVQWGLPQVDQLEREFDAIRHRFHPGAQPRRIGLVRLDRVRFSRNVGMGRIAPSEPERLVESPASLSNRSPLLRADEAESSVAQRQKAFRHRELEDSTGDLRPLDKDAPVQFEGGRARRRDAELLGRGA